jgi:hypothetical protein
MRLQSLFIIVLILVIAIAVYLFNQTKSFVDASNDSKPALHVAEHSATETAFVEPHKVFAEGRFHNVAHTGAGTATIYREDDGRYLLRLSEFETAPGVDLQVCLATGEDAKDKAMGRDLNYLIVAPLQEIMGDQTYPLPENIDLKKYDAVTIVSRRLRLNFATAPLTNKK